MVMSVFGRGKGVPHFELKTYRADARGHHLRNACARLESAKVCAGMDEAAQAELVLNSEFTLRKATISAQKTGFAGKPLGLLDEAEAQAQAQAQAGSGNTGPHRKRSKLSISEEMLRRTTSNFYAGHLPLNKNEEAITAHFVHLLSERFSKSKASSCFEVFQKSTSLSIWDETFGTFDLESCSLDFTGEGAERPESVICAVPVDPFENCVAAKCCDEGADIDLAAFRPDEVVEQTLAAIGEPDVEIYDFDTLFSSIKSESGSAPGPEPEPEPLSKEQKTAVELVHAAETNDFLVQARVLSRAGFETAEVEEVDTGTVSPPAPKKTKEERTAQYQTVVSMLRALQNAVRGNDELGINGLISNMEIDSVDLDMLRLADRSNLARLGNSDIALIALDWEARLLEQEQMRHVSLTEAGSIWDDYTRYLGMSESELMAELTVLHRAAQLKAPPAIPITLFGKPARFTHLAQMWSALIPVMAETCEHPESDNIVIQTLKLIASKVGLATASASAHDAHLALLLKHRDGDGPAGSKQACRAKSMRILAANAPIIFSPFPVSHAFVLRNPSTRFHFCLETYSKKVGVKSWSRYIKETTGQDALPSPSAITEQPMPADAVEVEGGGTRRQSSAAPRVVTSQPRAALPGSYDLRTDHPLAGQCTGIRPRWQRSCGSCWSFAMAAMISTRLCIASKGKVDMRPAPADIMLSIKPWLAFYEHMEPGATGDDQRTAMKLATTEGFGFGMRPEFCSEYSCSKADAAQSSEEVRNILLGDAGGDLNSDQARVDAHALALSGGMRADAKVASDSSEPKLAGLALSLLAASRSHRQTSESTRKIRGGSSFRNQNKLVSNAARIWLSSIRAAGKYRRPLIESGLSTKSMDRERREQCASVETIRLVPGSIVDFQEEDDAIADEAAMYDAVKREIMKHGPIAVGIDWHRMEVNEAGTDVRERQKVMGTRSDRATNHAVMVVGWRANTQRTGGSVEWLIQNSHNPASTTNFLWVTASTLPFDKNHKWQLAMPVVPPCATGDGNCDALVGNGEKLSREDREGLVGGEDDSSTAKLKERT